MLSSYVWSTLSEFRLPFDENTWLNTCRQSPVSMCKHLHLLLPLLAAVGCAQSVTNQKITVFAWPMDASRPQELGTFTYSTGTTPASSLTSYKPPNVPIKAGEEAPLVRVGLQDPKTKEWRGVVTSANGFGSNFQQKISLHVDLEHQPWHVGFSAYPKPSPTKRVRRRGEEPEVVPQVVTEVITPEPAPTPHLNRPVVVSPEGKVEGKDQEEKTFLQK